MSIRANSGGLRHIIAVLAALRAEKEKGSQGGASNNSEGGHDEGTSGTTKRSPADSSTKPKRS